MNTKALSEIAKANPTAESFFTYAACRDRNVRNNTSKISAIKAQMAKEGFHPISKDLFATFQKLAEAGVGELTGDLFRWNVSIKRVGEAGTRESKLALAKPRPAAPRKKLVVMFDRDKEINISFTANLTQFDVQVLAEKLLQECKEA